MAKKPKKGRRSTTTTRSKKRRPAKAAKSKPPVVAAPSLTLPAAPVDPMAWRHIDRDQVAELLGVHPDSVSDYTREGMPVEERGGRGAKSVYDAVSCLSWWRLHKTELAAKDVAQARAFAATADINELKAAEKRGELVPRDVVIREGQNYTKAWATKVRGLPKQLVLAGIITREQEAAVVSQCRDLLMEIAGWQSPADTIRAVEEAEHTAA